MYFFWQRLEQLSLKLTPSVITVLMVLLAAVPLPFPGLHRLMPQLTLISIYYWGVFLPGTLPYVFLFALGLVEDSLIGTPLGLSSFTNVIFAYLLTAEQRIFSKTLFGTMWAGFMLLLAITLTLQWLVMCIYTAHILPTGIQGLRWVMSCLAYPAMHVFFTVIYRRMYST